MGSFESKDGTAATTTDTSASEGTVAASSGKTSVTTKAGTGGATGTPTITDAGEKTREK